MAAAPRRRRLPGHRRRVEDEGEDEGGPEALDLLDDDSLTEGSVVTDDRDAADDSDTSNVDEASPTSPKARKAVGNGNGMARQGRGKPSEPVGKTARATITDTEIMLNGLSLSDTAAPVQEMRFDDLHASPPKSSTPVIVSSASRPPSQNAQPEPPYERRRREHEEYRRKRDEDPAFVPNRGAFFMHDHRGAGPSANGFRPFSRGGGRGGRGRGGFINQGGQGHFPFVNHGQMGNVPDPTTNAPWAHDMHEAVAAEPMAASNPRHAQYVFNNGDGPLSGSASIPRRQPNPQPINRTLSTEKHIGNAQVRVYFPPMKMPRVFSGVVVKQYTKLPDHRPPLRRDKPVRISLPNFPPRYIFPAIDRSFIFIPRAMRPNQQRMRGRPRSVFGSVGGFSRRTSIYGGGGSFYGSMYSPSIAMSRRSSITHDVGRDYIISPTGSTISRPPLPIDTSRQPVVRLPPTIPFEQQLSPPRPIPPVDAIAPAVFVDGDGSAAAAETSINDLPQPQVHPLPQKPNFQESRPSTLPMHQPRPQKAVSVESIESPTMSLNPPQPYQQAFHQQVPVQVSSALAQDSHHRHPSYPSQHSTGTPLSQIPERAIHAAPFQPNLYSQPQQQPQPPQQSFYGQPPYPMMQPQPGYFYPPAPSFGGAIPPSAAAPVFVPGAQPPPQLPPQQQPPGMGQPGHGNVGAVSHGNGAAPGNPNLISQEINGTFYYYDASHLPAVSGYPAYGAQPFVPVGMPAMMAPSPDGFFYPPGPTGMMYYHQ
ncbi:hypothetical protein MAPG_05525 [Magnaporthiopsis poae ATCC 64411]|uniref:Btz domain-containing protein n=1 Tax=Magnaporthiopsis poae (strain ATCC 64411 / 73-15) TaxID=644358 RepID=A0A0C4DZM0_MAGP6|nr:hypothetical protein MAPG_05525 [Magnaporthiopsis poae ATCC 64411]